MPIRTWATSELRPSVRTQVHDDLPYAREYLQHVYIHEARWCMKYVHIIETRYALACEHKKRSEITGRMRLKKYRTMQDMIITDVMMTSVVDRVEILLQFHSDIQGY